MKIKRFKEYNIILEEEEIEGNTEEGNIKSNGLGDEYLQDPSYYINQALNVVKNNIVALFDEPTPNEENVVESEPSSYYAQNMQLLDIKYTDMPMNKSLIIKYEDSKYLYHLIITIKIDQGRIEMNIDGDDNITEIDNCGVKLKKYDNENNMLGQLDRQKVLLKDINQDFIDTLNIELDEKFSIQTDEFEIEYKEED